MAKKKITKLKVQEDIVPWDQTPNLANSFHPVPKPSKKEKKEVKPIGPGKNFIAWSNARKASKKASKKAYEAVGIVTCEIMIPSICWKDNALGFAHIDKRDNLTEEEVKRAHILGCDLCHSVLERMPHAKMRAMIEKIIKNRKIQP
ncbi:MAG TPA: hypothetical protein VGL94_02715 [Ktedonobacteraceae bacterium]|jgi:hypothetical protein